MTGTITEVEAGDDFREDEVLGPDHVAKGRNAGRLWSMNANGQVCFGGGLHRADEADDAALHTRAHLGITLLGRVQTPADAYVVRVQPPSGRLEYRFYNPKTFLLDRIEEIRHARRLTVSFSDYRTTRGLAEPWHVHVSDGFATNDEDRVLVSLEVGIRIAPSELSIPTPGAPLISVNSSPDRISADMSGDDVIVPVGVAGHTVNFILDSGASGIVIDNGLAQVFGIKEYGRITDETAGTYVESNVVIPQMTVGNLTLANVHARSLPFAQWSDAGKPIGGLLGFDFIANVVWHIDYQHGTLEAVAPSSFTPPAGVRSFPVTFDDFVPTFGITIDGVAAPAFILDTGAYRSTIFSRYVTMHAGQFPDRGLGEAMTAAFPFVNDFTGVGGSVEYRPLELGPLIVGAWSFPTWLFDVTQNASAFEFEDYDGLMGQDFLRNFDVYLDYPSAHIYLAPNERFRQRWPA
ncbi:MAG TPA: retropepsin-like aspartic protease [Candidatus Cybelea sp.]|jgi:hypothetical protein|nr:retropepsin-like aspartic protease [Candidatus Cybelea sp.]